MAALCRVDAVAATYRIGHKTISDIGTAVLTIIDRGISITGGVVAVWAANTTPESADARIRRVRFGTAVSDITIIKLVFTSIMYTGIVKYPGTTHVVKTATQFDLLGIFSRRGA